MADFEELKLTVNLVDNASAGLATIRTQLTQLTQTAGQVQTAFTSVATSVQQVGKAAGEAAPKVSSQEKALKEVARSAEETTRGLLGMALASRRGVEAWAEMTLATREAFTGLKGASVAMGELGVASRLMVVGLGGVAIGIAAVGAAVAAYGISVFKFSKEMYTLSQTSKALGMTFGELRSMTEQNERFGISAENTIAQLGQMNEALTDLTLSGSKLRQQLLSEGVPAQWIDDYKKLTNEVDRYNKVREGEKIIHDDWLKRTGSEEIAGTLAGRFGKRFGVDPTAWTREPMERPSKEESEQAEKIATQSAEIAKHWREILKIVSDVKTEFLAFGLPLVNQALETTLTLMDKLNIKTHSWASAAWSAAKALALGPLLLSPKIREWAFPKDEAAPEAATPEAAPALPKGLGHLRRIPPLGHPSSYEGANDNRSLLHNASFGGAANDNGDRVRAVIKGGVYDALVEFYGFLQGGGTGGGGGVLNASLTTGNIAGAGGGRAAADIAKTFGGGGYTNLGGAGGGGAGGGGGHPHGSHVGAGAGEGAGETPAGDTGDTSKVGNAYLASQRARLKKELDDNPELKRRFAAIVQRENPGAGTAVAESAMNRAAMTGRSMASILGGGSKSFYGPVRAGLIEPTMRNMSAKDLGARYRQIDEAAAGSNIIHGHTDQGSAGDPNYIKGGVGDNINRERFNDWGGYKGVENSRRWREAQQAQVNKSAAAAAATTKASEDVKSSAFVPMPLNERYSNRTLQGDTGGSDTEGSAPPKRVYISKPQASLDRGALDLDRAALSKSAEVTHRGKLDVAVNAPPGTKVAYNGDGLLKNTSMQRQTQMMPTQGGPSASDSGSYMRGVA